MRGKLVFLVIFFGIVAYSQLVPSPLNSLVAFLVAGVIPGTNIMLGIWPMIIISLVVLYGTVKFFAHIKLKFLEDTSKSIVSEKLISEFKESNSTDIKEKNTSVIAAPHLTIE